LIAISILIIVIGFLLPEQITVSRTVNLNASPEKVFAIVSNAENQPQWRKDVKAVKMQPARDGWTEETTSSASIEFKVRRKEPDARLELEFTSSQGFSGYWVGVFTPSAQGTTLQITETVITPNPFLRVISRAFSFTDKFIDAYISDLQKSVEEKEWN
jgi:uncharacterized protein YndB with AHSA1/START domain